MSSDPPAEQYNPDKALLVQLKRELEATRAQCSAYSSNVKHLNEQLRIATDQLRMAATKALHNEKRATDLQIMLNNKTLKAAQALAPAHVTEMTQRHQAELEHHNLRIKALDESLQRAVHNEDQALEAAATARRHSEKLSRKVDEQEKQLNRLTRELSRLHNQKSELETRIKDTETRYNASLEAASRSAQQVEDLEATTSQVTEQLSGQEKVVHQLVDALRRNPELKPVLKDVGKIPPGNKEGGKNLATTVGWLAAHLPSVVEAAQKLANMVLKLKRDNDRMKGELQREKDAHERVEKNLTDLQNMVVRLESNESELLDKLTLAEDRALDAEHRAETASCRSALIDKDRQIQYLEGECKRLAKQHEAAWDQVAHMQDQILQLSEFLQETNDKYGGKSKSIGGSADAGRLGSKSSKPLASALSNHQLEGAQHLLEIGRQPGHGHASTAKHNPLGASTHPAGSHPPSGAGTKRKRGRPAKQPSPASPPDDDDDDEDDSPGPPAARLKTGQHNTGKSTTPFQVVTTKSDNKMTRDSASKAHAAKIAGAAKKAAANGNLRKKDSKPSVKQQLAEMSKRSSTRPAQPLKDTKETKPAAKETKPAAKETKPSSSEDGSPGKRGRGRPKGSGSGKKVVGGKSSTNRPAIDVCTEKEFYDDLCAFLSDKRGETLGRSQVQVLTVNGRLIDLFNLYKEVAMCGGFAKDQQLNWAGKIFPKMKNYTVNHRMTGIGTTLKRAYQNLLLDYEHAHAEDCAEDHCYICQGGDPNGQWISCDKCLMWQHFDCDPRTNLGKFTEYSKGAKKKFICDQCENGKKGKAS